MAQLELNLLHRLWSERQDFKDYLRVCVCRFKSDLPRMAAHDLEVVQPVLIIDRALSSIAPNSFTDNQGVPTDLSGSGGNVSFDRKEGRVPSAALILWRDFSCGNRGVDHRLSRDQLLEHPFLQRLRLHFGS